MAFDTSNQKIRQFIIAFIWPGPVAGPLPVNLFRILAPLSVFYLGLVTAVLVMWILTAVVSIFFFRLLELTEGKSFVENLLRKTPDWVHEHIERRGPITLFAFSVLLGVFTYAILLRLLRYPESKSERLLFTASFVSSVIWTGVFWGTVVEILRRAPDFAF